ncbi:MAG: hypothetical protein KAR57_07475, partial [Bacteroidales bacterium]|nr:hypothetical protein [Bacteroidales bacterium]
GMKPDEFKTLKKQFLNTSFILVFKANRDGSSKGGSDWVTPFKIIKNYVINCLSSDYKVFKLSVKTLWLHVCYCFFIITNNSLAIKPTKAQYLELNIHLP